MKYKVTLHGKVYEVEVERGEAMLLDEYPVQTSAPQIQIAAPASPAPSAAVVSTTPQASGTGTPVKSPLPGTVIALTVKEGDSVTAGTKIAVIEAMKMENDVVADSSGTVSSVAVAKGASVQTGDVLLYLS